MEARIDLGGNEVSYNWQRSRRRTMAITIHPERGVVVRTPNRTSHKSVEAFLREKSRWILKHLERISNRQSERESIRWTAGALVPFLGSRLVLDVRPHARRTTAWRLGERLVVEIQREKKSTASKTTNTPSETDPKALEAAVETAVTQWYREQALVRCKMRAEYFQAHLGVRPAQIRVRNQKRRWGSCSSRGWVNFNWRLILAPPEVLDYVVVHELCHLREMNHSARFWNLVQAVLPDFAQWRTWLRQNGDTLSLETKAFPRDGVDGDNQQSDDIHPNAQGFDNASEPLPEENATTPHDQSPESPIQLEMQL